MSAPSSGVGLKMTRDHRGFVRATSKMAAVLLGCLIIITSQHVWSQARVVKIVVPFPPGGGVDILARLLADQVGRTSHTAFIVENRPGAGSQIGTEAAARALPDGNTILVGANSFIINPIVRPLAYDPLASFEPICLLTRTPNVLVVNSASPYRSARDLIEAAHAQPGMVTIGFQGPGTSQHIGVEKLKRRANIDVVNVPFSGSAPAVNAILGNHVGALFVSYPALEQQLGGGNLRVLATASQTRIENLPEVPTLGEVLQTDFVEDTWQGALAPAKTPQEAVARLAQSFHEAILVPEVQAKLTALGYRPAPTCGADFRAFLRQQFDEYGEIIRSANIKAD